MATIEDENGTRYVELSSGEAASVICGLTNHLAGHSVVPVRVPIVSGAESCVLALNLRRTPVGRTPGNRERKYDIFGVALNIIDLCEHSTVMMIGMLAAQIAGCPLGNLPSGACPELLVLDEKHRSHRYVFSAGMPAECEQPSEQPKE
jgi:hypothetical protein